MPIVCTLGQVTAVFFTGVIFGSVATVVGGLWIRAKLRMRRG